MDGDTGATAGGAARSPWAAWTDPASWLLRAGSAMTPAGSLLTLLSVAARQLAGRRITVPGTGGELSLRVESLALDPAPAGLGLGQLDDLHLIASDVRWRDLEAHRVDVRCGNVHVRPLPAPVAVAAPVTVTVTARSATVQRRLTATRPGLAATIDGGRAWLLWARRPSWGSVMVVPEVSAASTGTTVLLRPDRLRIGSRELALPTFLPSVRLPLPPLARSLRLREVTVADDGIVLHLVADEWRESLTGGRLERLAEGLT